jgi:tol-pal system-associated acyl-CoA thioesterase
MSEIEQNLFHFRVNFEDVDAGGGVYHPNYLNFLERARSQMLRNMGYSFSKMLKQGLAFVVAENYQIYKKPAFLDDELVVTTQVVALKRSSLKVQQLIFKQEESEIPKYDDQALAIHVAQLRLVCVDLSTKKPFEIPSDIVSGLGLEKNSDQDDVSIKLGQKV